MKASDHEHGWHYDGWWAKPRGGELHGPHRYLAEANAWAETHLAPGQRGAS